MGSERNRVRLGFGNLYVSPGDHIGHFYQTRAEWRDLVVPFLEAGLGAGEKCVYLLTPGPATQELCEALGAAGVDVGAALASGQLILDACRDDPKALQDFLRAMLEDIPDRFPLLRWGGEMTWSLGGSLSSESLMEWETHCNVLDEPPAIFLCQYDLAAFTGSIIMDAMRTHPSCIVSTVLHENPFYENPEALLRELRGRPAANRVS